MGRRTSISFAMGTLAIGALLACLFATRAEAITAFSREYKTECTTCHTIFPQRNDFGRAFQDNGFVWPRAVPMAKKVKVLQTEEERKSAEFIKLSGITKTLPLSFKLDISYLYNDKAEDDFDQKRYNAEMFAGGAFGDDKIGFWYLQPLGSQSGEPEAPEELYFVSRHPFGAPLYIKAGLFAPNLSLWNGNDHLVGRPVSAGGSAAGFALSNRTSGLELSSILVPRVMVVLGMNDRNNSSNPDSPHSVNDFYGRVGVRIGGGDFLGNEPDVDLDKDSVWDFLGVTAGGFYYSGSSSTGDGVDRDLIRYGVEAGASYKKFLVMLGYTLGENNPNAATRIDSTFYSAEVNYVLSPMFALAVRYDVTQVDGKDDRTVITPGILYAPLQCFKLSLRVAIDSNSTNAATGKAVENTTATLGASINF